jgi:hypothetical protein
MQLPGEYSYQPAMVKCYKDIGRRFATGTMNHCTNAMRCAPKANKNMGSCVVLEQEYKHTEIAKDFHIASPTSSNFETRPNCLLNRDTRHKKSDSNKFVL